MSHNKEIKAAVLPDNLEQVAGVSKINGEKIILRDGRQVTADVILLATGYRSVCDIVTGLQSIFIINSYDKVSFLFSL